MAETIPLWPDRASENAPELTICRAARPHGGGVLVCPGGGYGFVSFEHEGEHIARWLNDRGWNAWLLRYSVVDENQHGPLLSRPIEEARRAMRIIRSRATEWGVQPDKLGVWGFSAGGHLASTLATHWDESCDTNDPIEAQSPRPDFQILAYPVVTMSEQTHVGSRLNLIGENPGAQLIEEFSNERHVDVHTPPAFLFHTADDDAVPVGNSLRYFEALMAHGVAGEMHIYQHGAHGVGLAIDDAILSSWTERLEDWLAQRLA